MSSALREASPLKVQDSPIRGKQIIPESKKASLKTIKVIKSTQEPIQKGACRPKMKQFEYK